MMISLWMEKEKNLVVIAFSPLPTCFFELFTKQALVFTCLQYKSFENTVGKGEIAHNKQFLLFPTVFSTLLDNILPFSSNLKLSSAQRCTLGKV